MSAAATIVHPLDARRRYARAFAPWVRRRARRLQAVFKLSRAWSVIQAANDYADFTGSRQARVVVKRHVDRRFDRLLDGSDTPAGGAA